MNLVCLYFYLFIYVFLHFMQKFKRATKSGGKMIFGKKSPVDSADNLRVKNFVEIAPFLR